MNKSWGKFDLIDYFDVIIGKAIDGNKKHIKPPGELVVANYITRSVSNNGINDRISYSKEYLSDYGNVIIVGNETAYPFIQTKPFFTGTKVNILIPKMEISLNALIYICTLLRVAVEKYSYAYTINSTKLKNLEIYMPINDDKTPDWNFMESYIKDSMTSIVFQTKEKNYNYTISLRDKDWGKFKLVKSSKINGLFSYKVGTDISKVKTDTDGKKGYLISNTEKNNGVNYIENQLLEGRSNVITIATRGNDYTCYYQDKDVVTVVRAIMLYDNDNLNRYNAQFIITMLNQLKYRYSYGRFANGNNIKTEYIKLPMDNKGNPDWSFMEEYIKERAEHIFF